MQADGAPEECLRAIGRSASMPLWGSGRGDDAVRRAAPAAARADGGREDNESLKTDEDLDGFPNCFQRSHFD